MQTKVIIGSANIPDARTKWKATPDFAARDAEPPIGSEGIPKLGQTAVRIVASC
jgi:hypothetical protein